ncbi:MAG TPA: hypothetical protein VGP43_04985 [Chitinophagaceae bacterium]|nr:hypothetical protein [Chitinophagaceae bacterium]
MSNNTPSAEIFSFAKDTDQLENIAVKYPWCSIAQLALLQHYKKNNSPEFDNQATKTALYFNNPDWLNWQLDQLLKVNKTQQNESEQCGTEQSESEQSETEQMSVPKDEQELPNDKIQQSLSRIAADTNSAEELPAFEPLHTVDYFLSQGIKATEDPATNDKLATQLKSFTEWLKSMKKIHKQALTESDEQTDKNIQQIAEHSNADAAVVTEAMANILVDQNKIEKAIEVYEKLSLLNRSKSAYFAAKINSLKAT